MPRQFRTDESYSAERITRNALTDFLINRGFTAIKDERKAYGKNQSQVIRATDENGEPVAFWVRTCWREGGRGNSALQISARIDRGDWEGTIQKKIARQIARGATHMLGVQRSGDEIVYAAAIPLSEVLAIWIAQRDISRALEGGGKNHAMNGSSPTLWLSDDQAPTVAEALWRHAGVRDLAQLRTSRPAEITNDSMDDLPEADYSGIGRDGASRVERMVSGVPRDPRVREAVRVRSNNTCERIGCGAYRPYVGFIDVHHILGAEKNDRVWTCVALCPNCHREAHMSPERNQLNAELLQFASQWLPESAPRNSAVLASA